MLLTLLALAAVVRSYVFFGALRLSVSGKSRPLAMPPRTCPCFCSFWSPTGDWALSRSLRVGLFHHGRRLWRGLYGGPCDAWVALWVMVALSAVACALLVLNVFRQRITGLAVCAGVYVAAVSSESLFVPGLFQKFIVQPSELALETPYLTQLHRRSRASAYNWTRSRKPPIRRWRISRLR